MEYEERKLTARETITLESTLTNQVRFCREHMELSQRLGMSEQAIMWQQWLKDAEALANLIISADRIVIVTDKD